MTNRTVFRDAAAAIGVAQALLFAGGSASASVTISSKATQNMSCANEVCAPTAKNATLNVTDLATLLSSGNLVVRTKGKGVQAKNIVLTAAVSWSTSNALTLDAYDSIFIDAPVSVAGTGSLVLTTSDGGSGGTLAFPKGNVSFANLSSELTINGTSFTLVSTIKALASAVATNAGGSYALANTYDASQDGTYSTVPVPTTLTGTVEGLGNAIDNLKISDSGDYIVGFFEQNTGTIRDLAIEKASVTSTYFEGADTGALVGDNYGTILQCRSSGKIKGDYVGGLVSLNKGTVSLSSSTASATSNMQEFAAGLVANNQASIVQSWATGAATGNEAGGLAGYNNGSIEQSYATGTATADAEAGGLVAENHKTIDQSYSTGAATASFAGGLIGYDEATAGSLTNTYWDTDTSGITDLGKGAGEPYDDPGITGLTTTQFQAGLPSGFDPSVWKEKKTANGGLPYLVNNPPAK